MLCKYRNIFGEPSKGVHSFKLFGIAIIDLALTLLAAYFLSKHFKWNIYLTILGLFLIAIIMHRIFCVNTTINKLIFGKL
jgi:hypothetical protein